VSSWSWDLTAAAGAGDGWDTSVDVEHDGRVYVTIVSDDVDDGRTAEIDPDDFEAMARSYLERMAEWRRRTAAQAMLDDVARQDVQPRGGFRP